MANESVTILCSGVALGVYVPGLLLGENIQKYGGQYELAVIESLFYDSKQAKVLSNKKAFHSNFRVALTGQKLSNNMDHSVDQEKKLSLFKKWEKNEQAKFIIFTGFWLNILEEYLAYTKRPKEAFRITAFHMDADISTSWKTVESKLANYKNIWMFSYKDKKINARIGVGDETVVPYSQRDNRYLVHGGGWGMGTYKEKLTTLNKHGMDLDIILYSIEEFNPKETKNRQYILDPQWIPWRANAQGRYEFPRFGQVINKTQIKYYPQDQHALYHLIKNVKAIISKPGGGTLLDSYASATPLIFLEPFGEYEEKNSRLWQALGFGISLEQFIESDDRQTLLYGMHQNIIEHKTQFEEYGRVYATENK